MAYIPMQKPQAQGFYNPMMSTPDFGSGIRDMLNNFMAMKQYRDKMNQQQIENQRAKQEMELMEKYRKAQMDRWEQEAEPKPLTPTSQQKNFSSLVGLGMQPERALQVAYGTEKPNIYGKSTTQSAREMFDISEKEWEGFSGDVKKNYIDEYFKRIKTGITDKGKQQKSYGSQINRAITDFDSLIDKLSDPTKNLDSKDLTMMSLLGVEPGETGIFKNMEDRTKDKARASVLKKMRNELQGYSNLATEGNLTTPQWGRAKEITGGFYETEKIEEEVEEKGTMILKNDLDPNEDIYEDRETGVKFVIRNGKYIQIIE